jgi:RNA polymerase sigma-70 factor (ECF subfamily)
VGVTDDEAGLIRRACQGDADARAELIDRHQALVYGLARHLLSRREEAEDVFQTVFLKLFEHLSTIDPERGLRGWLRKTTVNECFDCLKARRRLPASVDDDAVAASAATPPAAAQGSEVEGALREALDALSPSHRATVVLHYMEGLGYAEIAETLGVSVETVRSRLKRARAELRKRLKRYWE